MGSSTGKGRSDDGTSSSAEECGTNKQGEQMSDLVLYLSLHLTKLCLKALDGQVLILELLGFSLKVSQLLRHPLVGGLQLSNSSCGILKNIQLVDHISCTSQHSALTKYLRHP